MLARKASSDILMLTSQANAQTRYHACFLCSHLKLGHLGQKFLLLLLRALRQDKPQPYLGYECSLQAFTAAPVTILVNRNPHNPAISQDGPPEHHPLPPPTSRAMVSMARCECTSRKVLQEASTRAISTTAMPLATMDRPCEVVKSRARIKEKDNIRKKLFQVTVLD